MPPLEFTVKEKNKIQIVDQEINLKTFADSHLPSDCHIVSYTINGNLASVSYTHLRAHET